MKKMTVIASVVLSLTGMHDSRALEAKTGVHQKKDSAGPEDSGETLIRVSAGDWGDASPAEIEILLNAVAHEMLKHFPGRALYPIVVSPSPQGPVVLYQKGPRDEYQVLLAAKDRHWAEYVYEFSHELFHIFSRYDLRAPLQPARHQWFEEALCETASLYMLKRFSLSWEQLAPRREWRPYGAELSRFTSRALSDEHRRLPANVSFEKWFKENGPILATRPYLREKNELVAMLFLPLLEQSPDWRAVEHINLDLGAGETSFYDHLARWYLKTPAAQRPLVRRALSLFRYNPPAEG